MRFDSIAMKCLSVLIACTPISSNSFADDSKKLALPPNEAFAYLSGSWSNNLEECRRPLWTFKAKILNEKSDADGWPTEYNFPVKSYSKVEGEYWVEFEKGKGISYHEFEPNKMKIRALNNNEFEVYSPYPLKNPTWSKLVRCPLKGKKLKAE